MSRSATPAMRNEATPYVKPPKVCRTYQGTAIYEVRADGCGRLRLRTVADGCERLRMVANVHKRNDERTHPQPPDPQSEMGTLATHSGKKGIHVSAPMLKFMSGISARKVPCCCWYVLVNFDIFEHLFATCHMNIEPHKPQAAI